MGLRLSGSNGCKEVTRLATLGSAIPSQDFENIASDDHCPGNDINLGVSDP
jgi:hypothetical protein